MTSQHLGELARLLGGQASMRSSAQLSSSEGPAVAVCGYGELRLPLTAAQAKKLIAHGEPAPFGKGEETLVDAQVRHTWHFPSAAVDIDWHGGLDEVLEEARGTLDLPTSCRLEAQFHSLLVYERGQFFAPHQDSEKDDAMMATLVVVLPCPFSGGELVVHGEDGTRTYAGSPDATTMVALYADAVHEVLPVRTGHRIALTYNLLMHGDSSQRPVGRDSVADAEALLTKHFTTAETPRYGGKPVTPTRLAYLLDHSYTPRTLARGLSRLKGVDAERAAILTQAAQRAECEVVLGLADAHEVRNDNGGYGGEEDLIDSDVTVTHWLTPEGTVEEAGLELSDDEVVATTPSRSLRAYASEHEGYMGNYGNTVDRWYHRGALLVWPTRLAFANRVDAAPAHELRTLLLRLAEHDDAAVARDLDGLLPTWPDLVRTVRIRHRAHGPAGTGDDEAARMFAHSLALACLLKDDTTADALVDPFSIEGLRPEAADSLLTLTDARGQKWTRARVSQWFAHGSSFRQVALREPWVVQLPELCRALAQRPPLARLLLEPTWAWLRPQIPPLLEAPSTTIVRRRLALLGKLLAGLLGGVGEVADDAVEALRVDVVAWCADAAGDSIVDLLVPALNAAKGWPGDRIERSGMRDLAGIATGLLQARADRAPREADDWSIVAPAGCDCDLCEKLTGFLTDPGARVLEWPIAKPKRQHVHQLIDTAELPVRHTTRRAGSPYVLVLTKTADLFEREERQRADAAGALRRIEKTWGR